MTTLGTDPTAEIAPTGPVPAADGATAGGSPLRTERGHTIIAPKVAEKIARRAAEETAGICGTVTSGLSRLVPWAHGGSPAAADVEVGSEDDTVSVELTVGVCYPEPAGEVTRRARQHVVERLTTCTGLRVTAVDIVVDSLVAERPGPATRRVR